jgi:hypothetical protein
MIPKKEIILKKKFIGVNDMKKMRKTVELSVEEIKTVEDLQKEKKLKSFSEAIRVIINHECKCKCKDNEDESSDIQIKHDEYLTLLADAIIKMDKKLDKLIESIAPKSAGEI